MNILILGGTGAMGSHLAPLLCRENEVTVTSRSKRESSEVRYIQGDAHDGAFLQALLAERHWDCIVDFMHYGTAEFAARVDLLLSAAGQYIFLSSARVYADCAAPITEDSPRLLDVCTDAEYLATDEYALAKARCEDILRGKVARNWTIVRPSITYSETRLQLGASEKEDWLYKALHGKPIIFSDDLAHKVTTMTYAGDVARGIATLVGNEKAFGEAFHITGSDHREWCEVLDIYRDVLKLRGGGINKCLYDGDNLEPAIQEQMAGAVLPLLRPRVRQLKNQCVRRYKDISPNEGRTYKSLVRLFGTSAVCLRRGHRKPAPPIRNGASRGLVRDSRRECGHAI